MRWIRSVYEIGAAASDQQQAIYEEVIFQETEKRHIHSEAN
jgi:hypothetical protein